MHTKTKTLLLSLVALAAITLAAPAQSNAVESAKSEPFTFEFTLGGGGIEIDGVTEFGLDASLSTNPFKPLPNLWLGIVQGVAWDPQFFGATDVNANWSWHVFKELYLNTGWSFGAEYIEGAQATWRTGPEATLQYYVGENAFIYAGVNYDLYSKAGGSNWQCNKDIGDGWRYSIGIGITF